MSLFAWSDRPLTDIGFGPDKVRIFPMNLDADIEGNPIRRPVPPGVEYPAVVESGSGNATNQDGTEVAVTIYSILVYTETDPGVKNQDPVVYRENVLRVQSDAVRAGGGAWMFTGIETDRTAAGIPYGF